MPEITSPFDEPVREESKGEAQQRLASFLAGLAIFADIHFTETERDALAKVVGAVMRRWPTLKELGK